MKKLQASDEVVASVPGEPTSAASVRSYGSRWRFSLFGLFGLLTLIAVVLAVCSNLWRVPRPPGLMEISLQVDGAYVDGTAVSFEELDGRLSELRAQWDKWDERYGQSRDATGRNSWQPVPTQSPLVCLRVDGRITYAQFLEAIRHCLAAAVTRFDIRCEAARFGFVTESPIPRSRLPEFEIVGEADHMGKLTKITGMSQAYATPQALHAELLAEARNFEPRTPSGVWIRADFDSNLTFDHVSDVLMAVTTRRAADGSIAPLFVNVHFLETRSVGILR